MFLTIIDPVEMQRNAQIYATDSLIMFWMYEVGWGGQYF